MTRSSVQTRAWRKFLPERSAHEGQRSRAWKRVHFAVAVVMSGLPDHYPARQQLRSVLSEFPAGFLSRLDILHGSGLPFLH